MRPKDPEQVITVLGVIIWMEFLVARLTLRMVSEGESVRYGVLGGLMGVAFYAVVFLVGAFCAWYDDRWG